MLRRRLILVSLATFILAAVGVAYAAARSESAPRPGPVASGSFHRLTWPTSGRATLVRLRSGTLELRLRGFRTHPAPDLFVYLFHGRERTSIAEGTKLAPLQTTLGDSRYAVPSGFEPKGLTTVVIWCAACETESGAAELRPV